MFTVTLPPIRPVENALAVLAALLVAGSLWPWPLRLACSLAAVGVLILLVVNRWRAHTTRVQQRRTFDTYAQVLRLRAERKERFERSRPRRR